MIYFIHNELESWRDCVNQKTEESRIAYNKLAPVYDTSKEGKYTRFHRKELVHIIPLQPGDVVLDVACGNGTLLGELSQKARIHGNGIDISENMIHAAKNRCPTLNFQVKPCCPLEWQDETVEVITVCCGFHHFEKPQAFVNECKRVLKKGGAVYIAEPNFGPMLRFLANKFWFRFSKSGDVRIYSPKELEAFFYGAGFSAVQAYKKGKGVFLTAKK